ncbi:polysaccharide pyruvyl transferase family protein [Lachnoclostridium phytofermentans]|uniref:Polysaccharide pyruvyl transferase domain-containing protein n=1 Tax=Lachnoclostridium phytofermentans (strain ATCC 700394 / DSM 18823 / ISDg) TaxID=357809 RepID=A9KJK9_LACP7|nr:polysaccharide pyruvyl transferase family protein [Lachnoclostridium phytofermentans]ABX44029.1 conserved hypothetical protein [Lachnoclostridium phytofermentans ISDg]
MNKKVGIITFHRALNYGAVLQAYALQQFLFGLGIDNEIIDYYSKSISSCYSPFKIYSGKVVRGIAKGIFFYRVIQKKMKNFEQFCKDNLVLSKRCNDYLELKELSKDYIFIITGSDQVFSPVSAGFDEAYFLTFTEDEKKYSYAANLGIKKIPKSLEEIYRERLKGFQSISVGEADAAPLLQDYISSKIKVHIDPTLLLSSKIWSQMKYQTGYQKPYVLLYHVEKPIYSIQFAKELSKQNNLEIVYINDRTAIRDMHIKYVVAPKVEEFLAWFKEAAYVVTNSFHGTALSILFHKKFFVELENKQNRNNRAEELLQLLHIEGREICKGSKPNQEENGISWNEVEGRLNHVREDAKEYIEDIVTTMI